MNSAAREPNPFDYLVFPLGAEAPNGDAEQDEQDEKSQNAFVPVNGNPLAHPPIDIFEQIDQALSVPAEPLSEEGVEAFIKRTASKLTWQYYHEFWPTDGTFTLSENLIVLYSTGVWDYNATPIFSKEEMLFAYAYFSIIYGGYHLIQDLRHGEKFLPALWFSQVFTFQFWFFYFLDRDFDIDGDTWEERIPNIVIVGFLMAIGAYLLAIGPGIASAFCRADNAEEEKEDNERNNNFCAQTKKIMIREGGEAVAVALGTDAWAVPYYLPIDGFWGMLIKGFCEGHFANLCVWPIVYYSNYLDVKDDVRRGKLIPKTLQQEKEEEKLRIEEEKRNPPPSFCTRASNYFCNWMFRKGDVVPVPENKVPFLTSEEKEEAYYADTEQAPSSSSKKSSSKSKHKRTSSKTKSKRNGNDDEFEQVVELRSSSSKGKRNGI